MNLFRTSILAAALGATVLASASPALADGWRGHHGGDGGDDAAIAIGAGVVGLALGAAIASSGHHRRDRVREYDGDEYYEYDSGPRYREYYYYREEPRYPAPYYRPYYGGGYGGGYGRGWRGHEWREHHGWGRGW